MSEAEKASEKSDAPATAEAVPSAALEKGPSAADDAAASSEGDASAPAGAAAKEDPAEGSKDDGDAAAAGAKEEAASPSPVTSPPASAPMENTEDVVDLIKDAIDLAGYVPAKFERQHQTLVREWMVHPENRVLTMHMDADGALQIASS